MKVRIIAALLAITLLCPMLASADSLPDAGATQLRLLTANIWGDYFGNPVEERSGAFLDAFLAYSPDVIGMQECTWNWHKSALFSGLSETYDKVSMFLTLGVIENHVPIFYKKDRFELLDSGYHLYTETNDKSKAYTFAVLKDVSTGQVFGVFNTHFWWKVGAEHDAIRMRNAEELVTGMLSVAEKYNCPVFAFGDLNCSAYAGPFVYFNENNIIRLCDIAQEFTKKSSHHGDPVRGEDGLYHGKLPTKPEVNAIDHVIGLRGVQEYDVTNYQLILDQPVLDASDHSPVYADIVLYGGAY